MRNRLYPATIAVIASVLVILMWDLLPEHDFISSAVTGFVISIAVMLAYNWGCAHGRFESFSELLTKRFDV